ncbi:MAG: hypothetical protein EOM34_15980 [Clostridia bacterium]|nr:hypothetical protein [Clostridia bacterium]
MSIEIRYDDKYYIDTSITDETSDIADLDLSVSDYNYYRKLGFRTIGQLISKDCWYFFDMDAFSFRRFERLIRTLDELGFRLRDCSKEKHPSIEPVIASFWEEDRKRSAMELEQLRLAVTREQSRIRSRRYRARQKERKAALAI